VESGPTATLDVCRVIHERKMQTHRNAQPAPPQCPLHPPCMHPSQQPMPMPPRSRPPHLIRAIIMALPANTDEIAMTIRLRGTSIANHPGPRAIDHARSPLAGRSGVGACSPPAGGAAGGGDDAGQGGGGIGGRRGEGVGGVGGFDLVVCVGL